jgi:hypothetical protein
MYHRCIKSQLRWGNGITRFPVELSGESCFVARFEKAGERDGLESHRATDGASAARQSVDGIDTETGARRPKQIGTYPSKRAANAAASSAAASGETTTNKGTLSWLIDRWCASRTDIGVKSRMQYEWAGAHIKAGLGSLTLDKLDRDDIRVGLKQRQRRASYRNAVCRFVGWCYVPCWLMLWRKG